MAQAKTKRKRKPAKTSAKKPAKKAAATRIVELGEIPLSSIVLSKRFNRERIDTTGESFKGLVASVKKHGVIQPIAVRKVDGNGTRELIAGERRYRAAKAAKLATIPAVTREADDVEAGAVQLNENLWREDLTPLEEALQLKAQIDAGVSTDELAKQLGRTRRYIQRRASIANLSEAWMKATRNDYYNVGEWPAMLLECVAKLPAEVQDELLRELEDYMCDASVLSSERPPTVEDLDRIIGDITHELKRAPWKRDDKELLPDAGACATCPKRGAHNPDLWDRLAAAKTKAEIAERDICLDEKCWEAKTAAFVKAKANELEMTNGVRPVKISHVPSSLQDPEAVKSWEVTECKKSAKGARPAIQIDGKGAGRTCWVQTGRDRGKGSYSSSSTPAPKRTVAEKRAENDQKRAKIVYKMLGETLEAATLDDFVAALEPHPRLTAHSLCTRVMLSLIATYGGGSFWRKDGEGEDTTWGAVDGLISTPKESDVHVHLWEDVRETLGKVLRRAFRSNVLEDPAQFQEDSERIARLIGADLEAMRAAAAEKYPEPKSWAKEEAGTEETADA